RLLADRGVDADELVLPESVQALIAARLDTLSPERKSLLQDAAVLGKVFWAGALAEIGVRELGDVELALHELALKELVRTARTSSMEGESEYSFWHVLVRDVAYSQIPRAERTRRHRAAAAWIERKAGQRAEDLAEVLAHHYLQALELAEAAGDTDQAKQLAAPARRFLALAGEIATADRARDLAETLGLPEPALALGHRGVARAFLGHAEGLAEMERALALLLEQGAGQDAAVLQNHLAIARYPLEGPARSLA